VRRGPIDRYVHPLVFRTPTNFAGGMNIHDDLARGGVGPASTVASCQIHSNRADASSEST
jgi:hypothetical protein